MDMSLLGTWHYEFWHIGISMIIVLAGILGMIALIKFVPEPNDMADK